jgi:hypothetical protein
LNDTLHLLLCRVDTETKGLADAHRLEHALVCGEVKQLSQRQTCSIRSTGSLGLRAEVPQVCDYTTCFRLNSRDLGTSLQRLRMRAQRDRLGIRSRPPTCWLPSKGSPVETDQLTQGMQRPSRAFPRLARSTGKTLGRALLVPFLLRGFLRRRSACDRQTLYRTTTGRGFLPALNGGVSALENR